MKIIINNNNYFIIKFIYLTKKKIKTMNKYKVYNQPETDIFQRNFRGERRVFYRGKFNSSEISQCTYKLYQQSLTSIYEFITFIK